MRVADTWHISKKLICLSLFVAANNPAAAIQFETGYNPYIGGEFRYHAWQGSGDWDHIFSDFYQNGSIFVGNRYHPNFSVELGHYKSIKPARTEASYSSFYAIDAGGNTQFTSTIKQEGFSFDLIGHQILDPKFFIVGSMGLMTIHSDIVIHSANSTDLSSALTTVTGRNSLIARVGLGVEYLERYWGTRMKFSWETSSKYVVNIENVGSRFNVIPTKPFHNGYSFAVALFYRF